MDSEDPLHIGSYFEAGEPLGERWDLAFELGTDEYVRDFDFGDAPEGDYATLLEVNGPHHRIVPSIVLGETIDPEWDGQPHPEAMGDEDDGVEFTETLFAGQVNNVVVRTSSWGFLNAWLDVNQDGNWHEPHDYILENIELPPGEHELEFFLAEEAESGETVTRFRFSTEPNLWFNGFAMNGEVEDYIIAVQPGTGVTDQSMLQPSEFKLYTNYPNPFNPETQITYALPKNSHVILDVFSIQGKKIITLENGIKEAGLHCINWNSKDELGRPVSSGIYLCKLKASAYQKTIRMVLLR